jgi:hypothetical protein
MAMTNARNSKIVDKLVPQSSTGSDGNDGFPNNVSIVLSGYLQKTDTAKRWRLYISLDLSSRVEFLAADVEYFFQNDTDEFPLRPTVVWLKSTAEVTHVRRMKDEKRIVRHEKFLVGDIADTYMAQAAMGGLGAMQQRGGLLLSTIVAPCSFAGCGSPAPSCAE